MALDCEPKTVTTMMKIIEEDVWGQELAGAGGGGFMIAITKNPNMQQYLFDTTFNFLYLVFFFFF